jgi:hypothetical protein
MKEELYWNGTDIWFIEEMSSHKTIEETKWNTRALEFYSMSAK